jgi:hypothetical protein
MYHYSNVEIKEIDFSKCENGFWATSISPSMLEEHGDEIGFNGSKFCMELNINDDADCVDVEQDTAEYQIKEDCADFGYIYYDTGEIEYQDVVFFNNKAIKEIKTIIL